MRGALKSIAALALIVAAVLLARLATQAGTIGAGYAAKQICSGIFVARLPEQFVVSTDVLPRLATVGPLAELLGYEVNHSQREVVARMLGQPATAQYRERLGCTLHQKDHTPLFPFATSADGVSEHLHDPDSTPAPIVKPVAAAQAGTEPALQAALDTAFMEPPDGGRNTLAVIVMHRGEVVAERTEHRDGCDTHARLVDEQEPDGNVYWRRRSGQSGFGRGGGDRAKNGGH